MNDPFDHRYTQPGLELAHSTYPEVVPQPVHQTVHQPVENYPIPVSEPAVTPYKDSGSPYYSDVSYNPLVGAYGAHKAEGGEPETQPTGDNGSRRKLFILIGAIVAIAVIVGAVVGGVLGSKASSNGSKASGSASDTTSSPSPNSSASPQVNTTAVRANTKLSVTGRRLAGDGFTSRLFWQGGDNKIRTSRYTSTGGTWSTPLVFNGNDAKPGTPIAATIYLLFPQFEVFYLDSSSTFRGINFGEDETVPKTDSINTERSAFTVEDSSKMTAYWPYVIYQNENSTFHREVYDSSGRGWFNDTVQGWFNPGVVPLGDKGSGIAVVPTVKEYKKPYATGIAYRDQDGRLSIFSFGGDDTGISWHSGM